MSDAPIAWARERLVGYVPVLFTPYRDDGRIDHRALDADIDHILGFDHVAGLYVGSIYQEFWALSTDERLELSRRVVEHVDGRTVVMASASALDERTSLTLANGALSHGADMIMLWPPYFGPRGVKESIEWMTRIIDHVDAPFAVYNSGLAEVGFLLPVDALVELTARDNVVAVKEASLSLDRFLETVLRVGDAALVSSPLEEYWMAGRTILDSAIPSLLLGSSRFVWAQTQDDPRLCELFRSVSNDDGARGAEVLRTLLPAFSAVHSAALGAGVHPVGLLKRLRAHLDQSGGDPRPPIPPAGDAEVQSALDVLVSVGVRVTPATT